MKLCEYKGKKCKLWEDDGVGSCLAVFPEQCPYNSKKDVRVIKNWQRGVIKREGKRGRDDR